jgi:hypothetical protein
MLSPNGIGGIRSQTFRPEARGETLPALAELRD